MRQCRIDIGRSKTSYCGLQIVQPVKLRQHRKLQDQYGDARGGDGKKRLPNSFDQIDVVAHVNAPLTEMVFTVKRVRLPPRHRESTI